jgi:diphthamide synthase (EF-2-diphthine--ammonia ligase)
MDEAQRGWNARVCQPYGFTPVLPLSGAPTRSLIDEFLASSSTAVIVTARAAHLDASWLGHRLTADAVRELEALGVDPCGEHGECHTRVTSIARVHGAARPRVGRCDSTAGRWTSPWPRRRLLAERASRP